MENKLIQNEKGEYVFTGTIKNSKETVEATFNVETNRGIANYEYGDIYKGEMLYTICEFLNIIKRCL